MELLVVMNPQRIITQFCCFPQLQRAFLTSFSSFFVVLHPSDPLVLSFIIVFNQGRLLVLSETALKTHTDDTRAFVIEGECPLSELL